MLGATGPTRPAIPGPAESCEDGSRQLGQEHMRKARFAENRIVNILGEAYKTPVVHVAGQHGISGQMLHV